ncbi:MAG TPA: hypothetical protein VK789_09315 [Bryobacteraceae bacterium]|jgi:hypothetical protein|nr:hypothetical protein [Bryobacteraceae bacterium]
MSAPALGVAGSAALTFYDGKGAALKSATVSAIPGASGYLDLSSDVDLGLAADQRKDSSRHSGSRCATTSNGRCYERSNHYLQTDRNA